MSSPRMAKVLMVAMLWMNNGFRVDVDDFWITMNLPSGATVQVSGMSILNAIERIERRAA